MAMTISLITVGFFRAMASSSVQHDLGDDLPVKGTWLGLDVWMAG
jgi:hypothetical protein